MNRSFGLDVARFTAVSLVLVTHCGIIYSHFYGTEFPVSLQFSAFFGVEFFFILSGFLIGRILLRTVAASPGWRALSIFMARRWMRTLPLYYVWMAVLLLVLPVPLHLGRHLVQYATMTQNLAWPMPRDGWFSVSWSLTIEEWFYLLFSGVLITSAAVTRSDRCIWPVIAIFVVPPFAVRLLMPGPVGNEVGVYHFALFRLDAIAYGVALAKLWNDGSRLFRHPYVAFGAGFVIIAAVWARCSDLLPLPYDLYLQLYLPVTWIGCCLCLVGLVRLERGFGWVGRLVTAGSEISYGIYITHLTILECVSRFKDAHGLGPTQAVLIASVLIAAVPYVLYRFFELPILACRPRERRSAARAVERASGHRAPDFAAVALVGYPLPANGVAMAAPEQAVASPPLPSGLT
jgi:peptidoglycan/LPS O-acetylase OafA/YrhL